MIHVIGSGRTCVQYPGSYFYVTFPDELRYLEWALESLYDMASSDYNKDEAESNIDAVKAQLDRLKTTGTLAGEKLVEPMYQNDFRGDYYFDVWCAGKWSDFAPCATDLLIELLGSELENIQKGYHFRITEDEREEEVNRVQEYIERLKKLLERHDYDSPDYKDTLSTIIEETIEQYLQDVL